MTAGHASGYKRRRTRLLAIAWWIGGASSADHAIVRSRAVRPGRAAAPEGANRSLKPGGGPGSSGTGGGPGPPDSDTRPRVGIEVTCPACRASRRRSAAWGADAGDSDGGSLRAAGPSDPGRVARPPRLLGPAAAIIGAGRHGGKRTWNGPHRVGSRASRAAAASGHPRPARIESARAAGLCSAVFIRVFILRQPAVPRHSRRRRLDSDARGVRPPPPHLPSASA
jgi:hypothetical protein